MSLSKTVLGLLLLGISISLQSQVNTSNCSNLNYTPKTYLWGVVDKGQHTCFLCSGNHGVTTTFTYSCTYASQAQTTQNQPCTATSDTEVSNEPSESGVAVPHYHTITQGIKSGRYTGSAGATAASSAEGAVAVNSCLLPVCASIGITIPSVGTVNYSSQPYWSAAKDSGVTCNAYTLAPLPATGPTCTTPNPPYPPTYLTCANQAWTWNVYSCSWQCLTGASPVAIDTKGADWRGEQFTDPKEGNYVTFDLRANGHPLKMSWPKPHSGVAWLVIDSNHDGVIKDGTQVFGNFSPHANEDYTGIINKTNPTGFGALGWWDLPAQGGNLDGNISADDLVWKDGRLKLWIDQHCYKYPDTPCQSDPSELHSLEEFGITSISLEATAPPTPQGSPMCPSWQKGIGFCDRVGNNFRFAAPLNPLSATKPTVSNSERISNDIDDTGKNRNRIAIDVFVATVP